MSRDLTIKRKIMTVVMLTSITVLALTVAAFMTYDVVTFHQSMRRNLETLGRAIAHNSSAALAFKNERDAREILSSLQAEPQVVAAALYDANGTLFVTYPLSVPTNVFPPAPENLAYRFSDGTLVLYEPVTQGSERLGVLYLKADLRYFYDRVKIYSAFSALIVLGSVGVALLLSNWLQKRISDPLIALANTARIISERGDYSVRAPKMTGDEMGLLTDALNQMLTRIEEQTVALQQGEERLRLALEASHIGTWDWNLQTGLIMWDDFHYRLFGLKPGEFDGSFEQFLSFVHPESRASMREGAAAAVEQNRDFFAEFRITWPDGSVHALSGRGKAFYGPDGKPLRMLGVTQDITERKNAEEARAFLAAIVESSEDAIIGKDLSGRVLSWNLGAERMFDYTQNEMMGQPIDRILSPDRPDEEQHILEQGRLGVMRQYETVRIRKGGRPIHISLTVSPIRNPAGQIIGVSSISRDVSERIRAQEAIVRQSRVLHEQAQMLDLANVMARDLEDRIILWNSGMEKMYGWQRSEALGRVAHVLLQAASAVPQQEIRSILMRDGRWEGEVTYTRKDGRHITVASLCVLHRDDQNRPAAILEVTTDITDRKRAEQEILHMNIELEKRVQERTSELTAANNELEAFTYSVAHDLRAPLRHIDAFSRILAEDFSETLPAPAKRHLDIIRKGSQNMSRLVDDLLNLARVGRQELKSQATPLQPVVEEVIAELKREFENRQVEWNIGPLPTVNADPGLIKQVFANLLSNAVKYTRPRPSAIIEIGKRQLNEQSVIFVNDNGVGFNMKYADKLFGVFQRLHRAEEFEGTGVGLAIVERVIRRHGGRVWAESEVDKGATFYFTLPGLDKNGKET